MFGVKIKTILFIQDCFKNDLLGDARDTFPTDDPRLWVETSFAYNSDYVQYVACIYTLYIFMYIFRKVLSLLRTWKLDEVLLGYIQYVLFIASRLFRTGEKTSEWKGLPHSSTLHFHKLGLVSLTHT